MAKVTIKVNINGHEIGTISAEVADNVTVDELLAIVREDMEKEHLKGSVTFIGVKE